MDKKTARKTGLAARAALTSEERQMKSAEVFRNLLPYLEEAECIGCYVSMRDELDTYPIIQWCFDHGRKVCVPKVEEGTLFFYVITSFDDLAPSGFGVSEPVCGDRVECSEIDLMLVPLSSFDQHCNRTGYGKGYYDSVLSDNMNKIGICFAAQQVDCIETEDHDVRLDQIMCA